VSARCSDHAHLFETPRLAARLYRSDDRAAHGRLRRDPAVRRFMHWPEEETFDAMLSEGLGRTPPDDRGWINLAVIDRSTGALVGDHGLIVRAGVPCIGLALLPEHRRQGLGQELVSGSMAWLLAAGFSRVEAEIDYGNQASFALFGALDFATVDDRRDEHGPFSVLARSLDAVS
jgi:RimJ/RimL family protein N-acetyltransferase